MDELADTVKEIITLLGPLAALLPERPNKPHHGGRGKRAVAPTPWNEEASVVWMDIHTFARWHEDSLCVLIGLPAKRRGGSDQNTVYALERIPILAEQGAEGSWQVRIAVLEVEAVRRRTREVLGLQNPTRGLPKVPKHDPPLCPYCHLDTLRWRGETRVWCSNPTCHDNEGRKPSAIFRRGRFSGTESMCFQDGTMIPPGLPRNQDRATG